MTNKHAKFPDKLGAFEHLMLRGESDPRTRSAMLSITLLDTSPGMAKIRTLFDRASREFIRLRQHVVVPTLPVTAPRWAVDPDFDLDYHLQHCQLTAPAERRQLLDLGAHMMATPFDLARPLWELVLVEGLQGMEAEAALVMKLHHAVTDGIGGLQLFQSLYDTEPGADRGPMPPAPIAEELDGAELLRNSLREDLPDLLPDLWHQLGRGARRGIGAMRTPIASIGELRAMASSAGRVLGPVPAQPSPLLARRSLRRRLETLEISLPTLRAAAKAAQASINDAYIAALAGGLRLYHEARGAMVDAIPMAMPINLRKADDKGAGNQFAGARLALPIAEPDPATRIQVIRSQVIAARQESAISIFNLIAPVLSRLPSAMLDSLHAGLAANDVQASNVPGFTEQPYVAGARVTAFYPFGPLPGVALMVTMVSQAEHCFLGINADAASISDLPLFMDCLQRGFDEVLALAPAHRARRPPAPATKSRAKAKAKPKAKPKVKPKAAARSNKGRRPQP